MRLLRDLSDWATDALHTTVDVHFDFRDRLKILFGWNVTLIVRTDCENKPGRVETETEVSVWRPRKGPEICFEAIGPKEDVETPDVPS